MIVSSRHIESESKMHTQKVKLKMKLKLHYLCYFHRFLYRVSQLRDCDLECTGGIQNTTKTKPNYNNNKKNILTKNKTKQISKMRIYEANFFCVYRNSLAILNEKPTKYKYWIVLIAKTKCL